MGGDLKIEDESQDPQLVLAGKRALYKLTPDEALKGKLKAEILQHCKDGACAPLYTSLCAELGWAPDAAELARMEAAIEAKVKELDAKTADAEENLGDTEVREALLAKAEFLAGVGDKAAALAAFSETEKKTIAVGQRVDLQFSVMRLAYAHGDLSLVEETAQKAAKVLADGGGDWERKNRLKVYEGVAHMAARRFRKAADLFLESVATFTSYELCSYEDFIFYTIVASLTTLARPDLKSKVIDSPEVLAVIGNVPDLKPFLECYYGCDYAGFFRAFSRLSGAVALDPYLHPHARYFEREVRAAAYGQYLESYKTVTLAAMAEAFGVSQEFADAELCRFIAAGRLSCRVDKVAGVVSTSRPDAKTGDFTQMIKSGDALLGRVQRLTRVTQL